ncbi:histidine phosphatase family protein [Mucilaginibacter ginsenosidivorax]|uniref:Histidine phosphatase family protein n=1 Tax=Mucilaginibacter ginsenosidivorax TaxID=862126 RepID=A0A5B8VUF8_9SPHI|nr:histidine phosphatase family protein [Mucilaginibacter ginsenosidivorax]QEC75294.1 histidine phosphatase family protein [Mucilaginibacter ginsenosidivorax]
MKKIISAFLLVLTVTCFSLPGAHAQTANLKIVFIRHAEKPLKGDNLTCEGLNRSLKLPAVITAKFGIPAFVFVPSLGLGEATKHARMFQTIVPLAAKYNLTINSSRTEKDSLGMAADLKSRSGVVLVSWEHGGIAPIVRALGVKESDLKWPDDDYDSIWLVTFKNGEAVLTKDKEGIVPAVGCAF